MSNGNGQTPTTSPRESGPPLAMGAWTWTPEQVDLIKRTCVPGGELPPTDAFAVFLHTCKATGLDPLLREAYLIKRGTWDRDRGVMVYSWQTMVGRDGYLAAAHRTRELRGIETTVYPEDHAQRPTHATCKVWRADWQGPVVVTVAFAEYVECKKDGAPTRMWATKPRTMIAKVAESHALRRAFSLHGTYAPEELPSEDALAPSPERTAIDAVVTPPALPPPADPAVSALYRTLVAGLRGVSSRPHLLRHIHKHRAEWRALDPSEQSALRSVLVEVVRREGFESVADAITAAEALAAQDAAEGSQAAPPDDPPPREPGDEEAARMEAQVAALLARKREELAEVKTLPDLLRFYAANCDGRSGLPPAEVLALSADLVRRARERPFGLAGEPGLRRLAREAGLLS